jgi:DNA-3-methyladenine glycosylase II
MEINMQTTRAGRWLEAEQYLSRQDAKLKELIDRHGPCRLTTRGDYFASLCESIISQQLATKAADAICERFIRHFDHKPAPEEVIAYPSETLRAIGLSGQKAVYIVDLANKFLNGQITPDHFAEMNDQEIIDQLVAVKGVGPWTAQIFLIFALNRPDVFPVDDLGLKKAVQNLHLLPGLPDKKQMLAAAIPWHPYATVASWYLWRSLEAND